MINRQSLIEPQEYLLKVQRGSFALTRGDSVWVVLKSSSLVGLFNGSQICVWLDV